METDKMSQMNTHLIDHGAAFDALGLLHRMRDASGTGPHAAIVLIHGRSGDEDSMWAFTSALPKDWLLIAPRAVRSDVDGGYTWTPRKPREWPALEQFDAAVEAIAKLIRALTSRVGAGRSRAGRVYAGRIERSGVAAGLAGVYGRRQKRSDDPLRTFADVQTNVN
jgi:hypothetical protein